MLVQFYFCLKLKVCKLKKQYCLVLKIVFTFILKFTSFILKFTTLILKFTTFVQKFCGQNHLVIPGIYVSVNSLFQVVMGFQPALQLMDFKIFSPIICQKSVMGSTKRKEENSLNVNVESNSPCMFCCRFGEPSL